MGDAENTKFYKWLIGILIAAIISGAPYLINKIDDKNIQITSLEKQLRESGASECRATIEVTKGKLDIAQSEVLADRDNLNKWSEAFNRLKSTSDLDINQLQIQLKSALERASVIEEIKSTRQMKLKAENDAYNASQYLNYQDKVPTYQKIANDHQRNIEILSSKINCN